MKKTKLIVAAALMLSASHLAAQDLGPTASGQNAGVYGTLQSKSGGRSIKLQSVVTAGTNKYVIDFDVYAAPTRGNPSWEPVVDREVQLMMNRSTNSDMGDYYDPELLLQNVTESNPVLWVGVKIQGVANAKLSAGMVRITQWSSDAKNSLANRYDLTTGGPWLYNKQTVGVVFGTPTNNIMTSGDSTTPANALYFGGVQTPYYIYKTTVEHTSFRAFVLGQKLRITTQLEIVDTDGTILATAYRTISAAGSPALERPTFTIAKVNGGMVQVGYTGGDQYQSATLATATTVSGPWSDLVTFNRNQAWVFPVSDLEKRFFRLRR